MHVYAVLGQWVGSHGVLGVCLFMAIENLGIPFPTELAFVAAQALIVTGHTSFWEAAAFIALGHLVGAGVSYYAGRRGENVLVRHFGHSHAMMHARHVLQGWYETYGAVTILAGRLVGQVRPWASMAAGMGKVRPYTFWVWTTLGTVVYSVVALWLTGWGWHFAATHPRWRLPGIIILLIIFYGALVSGVTLKLFQRWRKHARHAESAAESPEGEGGKEKQEAGDGAQGADSEKGSGEYGVSEDVERAHEPGRDGPAGSAGDETDPGADGQPGAG